MNDFLDYLGRVHPLVIHLPLTLLLLGGVIELCRLRKNSVFLAEAGTWIFGLGALGAVVAVSSGWMLAAHHRHKADEMRYIELHRWFGIATAIVGLCAWAAEVAWTNSIKVGPIWTRRFLAWSAACLTIVAGHLGAVIVWGDDWFS